MKETHLFSCILLYSFISLIPVCLHADIEPTSQQSTQKTDTSMATTSTIVAAQNETTTHQTLATLSASKSTESMPIQEGQTAQHSQENDYVIFSDFNKPELTLLAYQLNKALNNKIKIERIYQNQQQVIRELNIILHGIASCNLRSNIGADHPEFQLIKQGYESNYNLLEEFHSQLPYIEMARKKSNDHYQESFKDYYAVLKGTDNLESEDKEKATPDVKQPDQPQS